MVITSNLNKKLKLFSDFYLPIEMIKKTNYELVNGEKTYTKEEAKQALVEMYSEKMEKQIYLTYEE